MFEHLFHYTPQNCGILDTHYLESVASRPNICHKSWFAIAAIATVRIVP